MTFPVSAGPKIAKEASGSSKCSGLTLQRHSSRWTETCTIPEYGRRPIHEEETEAQKRSVSCQEVIPELAAVL